MQGFLNFFFVTNIFAGDRPLDKGFSEHHVRKLNSIRRFYQVLYLLLAVLIIVVSWSATLDVMEKEPHRPEFFKYVGTFCCWLMFRLILWSVIERIGHKQFRSTWARIVQQNKSVESRNETATLANEINGIGTEFSIPEHFIAALRSTKREYLRVIAIVCPVSIAILFLADDSPLLTFLGFVTPLLVLMRLNWKYGKLFTDRVLEPALKTLPGARVDYSTFHYTKDAGYSKGDLFNIVRTARSSFGLKTSDMMFSDQLGFEMDGAKSNHCSILGLGSKSANGDKETLYHCRVLQIKTLGFEPDSSTLIKKKTFPYRSPFLEEVKLLSPEFNQTYEVYADDQIGSRKLLKPAVLERFIDAVGPDLIAVHLSSGTITALYEHYDSKIKTPSLFSRAGGEELLQKLWGRVSLRFEQSRQLMDVFDIEGKG